jgi:hypothetical protein
MLMLIDVEDEAIFAQLEDEAELVSASERSVAEWQSSQCYLNAGMELQ